MKKTLALVLALVLVLCLFAGCGAKNDGQAAGGASASGGEKKDDGKIYEYTGAFNDSSTSMCNTFLETLFNAISEESGGRMKFTLYPGGSLYGPSEAADAVKDGAADFCWTCTAFMPGRFPLSEAVAVNGNGINSARYGGDVIKTLFDTNKDVANEWKDWHVISISTSACYPISTVNKKIEKPEDLKGLQMRCAGTVSSMFMNAIGGTAVSVPTNETYESLSKGVLDGMCNDWHNIDCFKLYECIKYCMNYPMCPTPMVILMNKDRYNELPDDLKAIIDKYSGEFASDMGGYWWDSCIYWVGDKMRERGVEIYEPNDEVKALLTDPDVLKGIKDYYIEYVNGYGYDGAAYYAEVEKVIADLKDAHAHDWDAPFNYTDWDMSTVNGYNESH